MSHFFLLGVDHRTAPGPVRERLHKALDDLRALVRAQVASGRLLDEGAFLTTCGRLEFYGVARNPRRVRALLVRLAVEREVLTAAEAEGALRFATDEQAALHLFRVASGLESAIQGEVQILGQVKRALSDPLETATLGPRLHRLFEMAIAAGKRVRTETKIGRGAASLAGAALGMLSRQVGSLRGTSALVLGAGETGVLVAELLLKEGARVVLANRTESRAVEAATRLGGEGCSLDELPERLARAELVVGSVGEVGVLVSAEEVRRIRERTGAGPCWFVDLAHPRNLDPALSRLPGVTLVDLERVERSAQAARDARAAEVPRAEALVQEEVERFRGWLRARPAVPRLRAVREQVLTLAMSEAERYGRGLDAPEKDRLCQFARALARTLLHQPTVALREADPATDDGRNIHRAADVLFGLRTGEGALATRRESA